MDGPLAGGLATPDRPRGPERLPGPAPRDDIKGGAEAAEGEGGIFQSTHYLPVAKEGPRDILDGRGGITGKRVGAVAAPGLVTKAQRRLGHLAQQGPSWDSDSAWVQRPVLALCLVSHFTVVKTEAQGGLDQGPPVGGEELRLEFSPTWLLPLGTLMQSRSQLSPPSSPPGAHKFSRCISFPPAYPSSLLLHCLAGSCP